jgi:hypothetical protein
MELFDTRSPLRMVSNTSDEFVMELQLGQSVVEYVGEKLEDGVWYFSFSTDGTHEKTGKGSELKVFSALNDALGHLITAKKPNAMVFLVEPNESNREKLYLHLIRRFFPEAKCSKHSAIGAHIFIARIKEEGPSDKAIITKLKRLDRALKVADTVRKGGAMLAKAHPSPHP